MAKRRSRKAQRAQRIRRLAAAGALLLAAGVLTLGWGVVLAAVLVAGLTVLAWWGRRVHRRLRARDREWQRQEAVLANSRSLTTVDTLSGTAFEELVAARLREDGCTEVERVGGGGDQGRDVTGRLPDGRTMVVQCKRLNPKRGVDAPTMQRLLGTRTHFAADLALCVTNTRFTTQAAEFAVANGIVLVHRDVLGPWLRGARLATLIELNGAGLGDRAHLRTWRQAYGAPHRGRTVRPQRSDRQ
ncbi:restriction endonuclease [Streptomyces sp. DSM 44915]|uniref:Restriction endonuclease n=1 Tax=Streptomyces chisholmiae TaxID=3075540 RepID=A0ABU2JR30_9ACTN|nr:restriction endonuclease [Streptomyces sp. DSM 44915]MDT0267431.1 restriction endonuclease [Streptomyces sp. DSM 44915]